MLHDTVSRTEVYSAITKYHEELSRITTPPRSLGTPPSTTSTKGQRGSPKARPGAPNRTHRVGGLRFLLERLLVAFHPNSIPLLPCAEWILAYYPPNPLFFRSLEALTEGSRDSDADRVSRVIFHNSAQIGKLRQTFSELMWQIKEEKDQEMQAAIIGDMERLGVEWGIFEGRIQTVTVWFRSRWGMTYGTSS